MADPLRRNAGNKNTIATEVPRKVREKGLYWSFNFLPMISAKAEERPASMPLIIPTGAIEWMRFRGSKIRSTPKSAIARAAAIGLLTCSFNRNGEKTMTKIGVVMYPRTAFAIEVFIIAKYDQQPSCGDRNS